MKNGEEKMSKRNQKWGKARCRDYMVSDIEPLFADSPAYRHARDAL
jgi:hypothetical protein